MRVGYVVHTYPALSHAFIQREVQELRRAGMDVRTLSIHRAEAEDISSAADVEEAAATEWVLPASLPHILGAHLRALSHPAAYLRTLSYALRQAPTGLRGRLWQLFYFGEAMVVWAWARRNAVDHLHAHLANVATDDIWLASVYERAVRPEGSWRWSFSMHGPTEFSEVERFNLARKTTAADAVVCISDYCRSQLMVLCDPAHWSKLVVVHCGADLGRYRYRPPRAGSDGPLRVLCVGQLVRRKGQAVLLDALALLHRDGEAVTATFVGRGQDAEFLRGRARELGVDELVTFAGPRGQDELPDLLDSHDVFCLPSFAEGIPVVLMEAMAAGLPVVTTPIAGVPELVTDGDNGLLVPPGRPDSLADALIRLGRDPELRARLSARGRKQVERQYDSSACAAELATLFEASRAGRA